MIQLEIWNKSGGEISPKRSLGATEEEMKASSLIDGFLADHQTLRAEVQAVQAEVRKLDRQLVGRAQLRGAVLERLAGLRKGLASHFAREEKQLYQEARQRAKHSFLSTRSVSI